MRNDTNHPAELLPNILDVEASSLDPIESYPIEIGWVFADGTGGSMLINPESAEGWSDWDPIAEESIHGICRSELCEKGMDVFDAARTLNRVLGGQVWHVDAYIMDSFWVSRLFEQTMLSPNFKLRPLDTWLERLGGRSRERLEQRLAQTDLTHRALEDCRRLLQALAEVAGGR